MGVADLPNSLVGAMVLLLDTITGEVYTHNMELVKINIMKNLKHYSVKELSVTETLMINGGFWRVLAAAIFWHWDNWDDIKDGFESAQR